MYAGGTDRGEVGRDISHFRRTSLDSKYNKFIPQSFYFTKEITDIQV